MHLHQPKINLNLSKMEENKEGKGMIINKKGKQVKENKTYLS